MYVCDLDVLVNLVNLNGIYFIIHRQLTPLHMAAERGYVDTLELLVKHGAKVSLGNHLLLSPTHTSICYYLLLLVGQHC